MSNVSELIAREHGRLRELLETLVVLASQAEDGEREPRLRLADAVAQVKRALHRHALAEERLAGHLLDAPHDAEDAAALHLRVAVDLEDILVHVAEIVRALEDEERIARAAA
jgi:hypothetical protein